MPDRPTEDDLPRFVFDLDDIADVDDLELPDVKTPEQAAAMVSALAVGSELRPRVVAGTQNVPNELDLALMAYLLDIDVPPEPPAVVWPSADEWPSAERRVRDDESIDESPTPRVRR
jgi:hypothetical protein